MSLTLGIIFILRVYALYDKGGKMLISLVTALLGKSGHCIIFIIHTQLSFCSFLLGQLE